MSPTGIGGGILVRGAALNVAAQALPLAMGLISVPVIIAGFGVERFGVLAFATTLLGILSISDFGLGSAVTKLSAEALWRNEPHAIPRIFWSAVLVQIVLGAIGAGILIVVATSLVTSFVHISPEHRAEAALTFRLAGLSLPIMLVSNSFRGLLEAAQRFDISAGIKGGSSISMFLIPLAGVFLGWGLPRVVGMLLMVRLLLAVTLLLSCIRSLPGLGASVWVDRRGLRQLFGFGGWVMSSGLIGLALAYGDRLVIANALPITVLTHYTVPLDVVLRLGLISGSLATVLYPAFSGLGGAQDYGRLRLLFNRSAKYAALLTGPFLGMIAVFAPDMLKVWLGPAIAEQSAPVLRILAIGAAFQILAVIPSTLVHGLGRPDLNAKLNLLQAPVYLIGLWWLVRLGGIQGAALAWSARFVLEGFMLLLAAARLGLWSWGLIPAAVRVFIPVALVCIVAALVHSLPIPPAQRVVIAGVVLTLFYWWVWSSALTSDERRWMLQTASGWRRKSTKLP